MKHTPENDPINNSFAGRAALELRARQNLYREKIEALLAEEPPYAFDEASKGSSVSGSITLSGGSGYNGPFCAGNVLLGPKSTPPNAKECDSSTVPRSPHRTDEEHAAYVCYLQYMANQQNTTSFSAFTNSLGCQPAHNHILDEVTRKWRCLGPIKHRFIRLDGSPLESPAAK